MSDPAQSRPDQPGGPSNEHRNLPVPVARPAEHPSEGFFARIARAFLGWKSSPTRADIEVVLEAAVPGETGVSPEERTMLKNILALRGRRIDDVMVPRADIVAVQQDIALGELVKVFEKAAHSRLVVYNDTLDDSIGMVHIRDLIAFMTARATVDPQKPSRRKKPRAAGLDLGAIDLNLPLSAANIVRSMLFVPPSMPAVDLLAKMQATRIHLALVVDEYGGTDGLVTLEDVLEELVGEIADEKDVAEDLITRVSRTEIIAEGDADLREINQFFHTTFPQLEHRSLNGYLLEELGRVPESGETLEREGIFIEVLDATETQVERARLKRADPVAVSKETSEKA